MPDLAAREGEGQVTEAEGEGEDENEAGPKLALLPLQRLGSLLRNEPPMRGTLRSAVPR